MKDPTIDHVFAGIPVKDFRKAIVWYTTLFGRPPDVIVRDGIESMWQLADKAWVYVVRDPERAGKSLVTVLVSDLRRHISALSARGIERVREESLPGVYEKAILADDDGNTVTFGEVPHESEDRS